jgi:hypothetical protein
MLVIECRLKERKKVALYSRAHGQIDKENKSCESSEQEKRNGKREVEDTGATR